MRYLSVKNKSMNGQNPVKKLLEYLRRKFRVVKKSAKDGPNDRDAWLWI